MKINKYALIKSSTSSKQFSQIILLRKGCINIRSAHKTNSLVAP